MAMAMICGTSFSVTAETADPATASRAGGIDNQPGAAASAAGTGQRFYVQEYRISGGGHLLPQIEVESAVYPYLGPYRTTDDVEQARAALESAYRAKGYQTITVQIPPQQVRGGIITLQVVKGEVGRLRVKGSRYFSLDQIKREAPSVAEGTVPNFNDVSRDIVALNQMPDRRITPTLRSGETPGTVDVDLNVKDSPPLHGSLEINNRYSVSTTPLRINGSVDYDNLWQLGHTLGLSFQLSPEDVDEVKVFSGYYLARVPEISWLSLMLLGTKQESNVSTLGGIGVAGRGETVGARAIFSLPAQKDFYHSLTLGIDYKNFDQGIQIAGTESSTPIIYYPLSASYSATWAAKGYSTELNSSINLALRGVGGSDEEEFDAKRSRSSGNFIYFRGDLSHTRDLPWGFQVYGKVQGQAADEPLVDSEQFSGGGLGSVRGYLESEALGDNALLGSVELRSPSLGALLGKPIDDWRFYGFSEGGLLAVNRAQLEQTAQFDLVSIGVGSRIRLFDGFNGSLDLGMPLIDGPNSKAFDYLLTFRAWAEF